MLMLPELLSVAAAAGVHDDSTVAAVAATTATAPGAVAVAGVDGVPGVALL